MTYYLTELVEEDGFRLCYSYQSLERIERLGVIVGKVLCERRFDAHVDDRVLAKLHSQLLDYYQKKYSYKREPFLDLTRFAIKQPSPSSSQ